MRRDGVTDERAEHEQLPVGEVDETREPEDDCDAKRDEQVDPARREAVEDVLAELDHGKQSDAVAPAVQLQANTANGIDHELRNIFTELVTLLSRKNIVNDSEGMALLRKLSK